MAPQSRSKRKSKQHDQPKEAHRQTAESQASKTKIHYPKHPDEYSATLRAEQPAVNPLLSFLPKPIQIYFDSQLSEEKIVLVLRRHPVTQIKNVLIAIAIFFMPILFFSSSILDFFPINYKLAFIVGWYMILISFILESFLIWFFNVFIITDERVIDVDFINLIFKNVTSAKIDNIQDISSQTGGFLHSLVDFGTIYIQTASETARIEFEDVPHPAKVVAILNELILEEEQEKIEGRAR